MILPSNSKEGDRPIPVSLLGVDDGPSATTLSDQVAAVVAAAESCENPMVVGHSAGCTLAWMVADRRDLGEAVPTIEEAIGIAERTGHRHREAALRNHLADLHHQAGRDEEAALALTGAVALFADVDAGEWEPELWLLRQW